MVTTVPQFPITSSALREPGQSDSLTPDTPAVEAVLITARKIQAAAQPQQALQMLEQALRASPMEPDLWVAIAEVLIDLQDLTAAHDCLKQALLLESEHVNGRVAMGHLHFKLGKLADEQQNFSQAFEHFRTANSLVPVSFDIEAHCRWVDETMALWTPEFLHSRRRWGDPTEAPIFIVGMPGSGTSLVERILSAHSQVQGPGQRPAIWDQIVALGRSLGSETDLLATARRCTEADIHEVTGRYLSSSNQDARAHFTDKMATNFLHLGWIALCFPQAKIVHCQRDLRDVVLSCYFQHSRDPLPFSGDLRTLGRYALEAERLMAHWRTVLPGRIIDVSYEMLVDQPDAEIQRLLVACGLPAETGPFERHRYACPGSACRRWENYREHLQPLLDVLENPVLHGGN